MVREPLVKLEYFRLESMLSEKKTRVIIINSKTTFFYKLVRDAEKICVYTIRIKLSVHILTFNF